VKKVAIIQSNYIPWKGYFDVIRSVDEFILLDEVQYTRRDWRNRNLIKTESGLKWLTIPVNTKGNYQAAINEITLVDDSWKKQHWNTIAHNYSKAQYFHLYAQGLKELYINNGERSLSKINYLFIKEINKLLAIDTKLSWSTDYDSNGSKTRRLVELCKGAKADIYLSGPSAKSYLEEDLFKAQGIEVQWVDYSGYPEYRQLYPPFTHQVSVLDLLFNEGPKAITFMKNVS
jgi:hypothetical protein